MKQGGIFAGLAAAGLGVVTVLGSVGVSLATATSASASPAPIIVKGVATLTQYPGVIASFDARIARFNKAGGVDGHKIESLGVVDDAGNASTNLTEVQAMVENNHVFAVTPILTQAFQAPSSIFLDQNQTLYVGPANTPNWCKTDYGFPMQGCLVLTNGMASSALSRQIKQYEKKYKGLNPSQIRYAQVALDLPSSTASDAYVGGEMKADGIEHVVYNAPVVPYGATNMTPYVEAVAASNPTIVDLLLDPADDIAFSAAWYAAGEKGVLFSPSVYNEAILKQPNVVRALQGELVNTGTPAQEQDSPAIKQIRKDLKAIGKGGLSVGLDVSDGYWSADVLIGLLENDAKHHIPFTSAATDAAANKGWTYSSGIAGGNPSETYPKAHTIGKSCATLLIVKGAAYKLVLPYQCYPNIKLS